MSIVLCSPRLSISIEDSWSEIVPPTKCIGEWTIINAPPAMRIRRPAIAMTAAAESAAPSISAVALP